MPRRTWSRIEFAADTRVAGGTAVSVQTVWRVAAASPVATANRFKAAANVSLRADDTADWNAESWLHLQSVERLIPMARAASSIVG